jgi:hypothetical protein
MAIYPQSFKYMHVTKTGNKGLDSEFGIEVGKYMWNSG